MGGPAAPSTERDQRHQRLRFFDGNGDAIGREERAFGAKVLEKHEKMEREQGKTRNRPAQLRVTFMSPDRPGSTLARDPGRSSQGFDSEKS